MKKGILITTLVAVLIVSASIFAFGGFRWYQDDQTVPVSPRGGYMYNTQDDFQPLHRYCDGTCLDGEEIAIEGTIVDITFDSTMKIIVETEDGNTYEVHTGPIWLYDGIELKVGATVSIDGNLVTTDSGSYVVVSAIDVDGNKVVLRDDDGFINWARGRMNDNAPMGRFGTVRTAPGRARGSFGKAAPRGGFRMNMDTQNNFGPGYCWR
ncbi:MULTISPECIES: hypothetical protein [unclassified Kosmotoga]|uniref:hypothetical protein n=1 Tax=unclassified Kosmotoga TaxID=2631489 RepID=UPI0007C44B51|nr:MULTISPECIES: hypothetical protein [unclassified Kosmotoga]MDI3524194.1 hypothetical protein [Kosmotoga sp.]MDK2953580.1 hypothetical protein [Kosmotoga sp.]OAA22731.1 hypothetical protein DU53_03435 [Kosmotoga sp. DU53]